MKAKLKIRINNKGKFATAIITVTIIIAMIFMIIAELTPPKVIGYTYASGNSLWDIAEENCPENIDILYFISEVEKINGIQNSIIYKHESYKIPVFESENEYLNMTTVIGFETTENGLYLYTNDGNGYYIEGNAKGSGTNA